MAPPVITSRVQGIGESLKTPGGKGRLDLHQGGSGVDGCHRGRNGIPNRAQALGNPHPFGKSCDSMTQWPEGDILLGREDLLHAPYGARTGGTPVLHSTRFSLGGGWNGPDCCRPFTKKSRTGGPSWSKWQTIPRTWPRSYAVNPPIWGSTTLLALECGECGLIPPGMATTWCGVTPDLQTSLLTWSWKPTLRARSPTPTLS